MVNGMIQDVDKELSDEEITLHLRFNIKVGAVRRLEKSSTVKVTFRGKILPTHVLLGHVRHPVHPFQERPIQCLNCFGFGHKRVAFKRPKKCEHCGKPHESTDITCQSMPAKCVNCGQEHEATARFCSKRKKLGQIQAYSKSNSVGFHVAKPALECDKHFPEMESTRAGSNAAKEPTVTELKHSGEQDMKETSKDPTRTGNSVTRDTCPDLALTRCGRWSKWSILDVNLGSDRAIAQVDIAVSPGKKFLRKQALTDWDTFRAARTATHSEREHDDASLASWTERLMCDKDAYTETINLTTEFPEVDRHLLHLWEARHGLIKRWKRQKLNRKLKKRIAAITVEALEYAPQLEDGKATHTLTLLQNQVTQILRIMHRVASRRHGLRKDDTIKLVNALVVSRIIYATAYLNLTKGDEDKLDVLMRKAYKTALGLPPYTSTEKLPKLGVHNTFRELVDGHLATQQDRLAQTPAGRKVLESLKIPFQWNREDTTAPLPRHIWSQIKVHTIPPNMDPTLHAERLKARARFYQKAHGKRVDVLYTDAATYAYQRNAAAICVVDGIGSTQITASLRTSNTTIAEEFAIAMAIVLGEDHVTTMSYSQAALRRFLAGRVSPKALKVLTQRDREGFPTV
ncbi:hypothetical protein HPB47_006080 [Ixodes persulcatus]|uniref:Uncharacterized protein n=1 Tax=Ixodes persulcatus TaxID=34615 RepID=A0AC60PB57_IXOPE|nr:hypothetical protein HPB47_006080 [Ixodes persulcatus]